MSEWHPELRRRIERLELRPEREAAIVDELAQHLEDEAQELVAKGATEETARATAIADLDAPGELARRLQETLGRPPLRLPPPGTPPRGRWFHARAEDLHYAVRSLRRSPAFVGTVVVTLGLTIGPTTALLSIGNWLLWRPTPGVSEPTRVGLVTFGRRNAKGDLTISTLSNANLADLRRTSATLTAISGVLEQTVTLTIESLPAREVPYSAVTGDFFDALGVRVAAGRPLQPSDDESLDGARVAVVSDGLARRAFGSAQSALGKQIAANGHSLTVVGVAVPEFVGIGPLSRVDLWMPGATYGYVNGPARPAAGVPAASPFTMRFSTFVIRLRPNVSFFEAEAELSGLMSTLGSGTSGGEGFANVRAEIVPQLGLAATQRANYQRLVRGLMSLGSVLLILGCANVANLMTMRSIRGQRAHALRLALGASRARLASLQLTESAVLAGAGAVVGVLLTVGLKQFFATMLVPTLATWTDFSVPLDARVLAITLGVSVACGLAAGVVPALLHMRKIATTIVGHAGGRSITGGRRVRAGLAVVQMALSLALLVGAFMLVATLRNLWNVELGLEPAGVTVHRLSPGQQSYSADRSLSYYQDLLQRVGGTRAEVAALSANAFRPTTMVRIQDPAGGNIRIFANAVSGAYFDVLGIPLRSGRAFADHETLVAAQSAPPLAVISASLARRLFQDADPLGQRVVLPGVGTSAPRELSVIGVAGDVHWNFTGGETLADPDLQIYVPLTHPAYGLRSATLLVKSHEPVASVLRRVETAAMAADPALPVQSTPLRSEIEYRLRDRTTFAWVLSMLGWLGLTLAAVGLYGLLSQSVTERTREFGIRLAVGSGRAHIFALVIRQAAWIGTFGAAAGLGLAVWGTRLIEVQLFGVTRSTPGVYGMATGVLLLVVFLAGLWPARAATRIEPVAALREE